MRTRRVWRQTLSANVWLFIGGLSCLAHEAALDPVPSALTALRKPAPAPDSRPYEERFQALIKARYPDLFTKASAGLPIITVLFDPQGGILRTDLEVSSKPPSELPADESNFSRFGAVADDLQYLGAASVRLPANTVVIVFAGVGSRDVDQALVQRFFPQVFQKRYPLSDGIWILFDHEGGVQRAGQEHFKAGRLKQILQERYPSIRTSDMTATPVVGRDGRTVRDRLGQPLQLYCVWLVAGSPLPK
jgi:hypothetical protein